MIGVYLTQLLISLLRQIEAPQRVDRKSGSLPLLDAMLEYMENNLSKKVTLSILAQEFHVSQSYVKRLFSQYKQTGAIHLFNSMKIDKAKQLLRESDRNVSQIAEFLGYDNSFYFCSQFKKFTGMSPLEYRRSVNAIGQRARMISEE
jgi:YesN/AraC family two-component response regulator